jgi:hypothetical protein
MEVYFQSFLNSALHRAEWSAVGFRYFAPGEKDGLGSRIGMDALEKREIIFSWPGVEHRFHECPPHSVVAILTTPSLLRVSAI